jgi:hypothetical protein
MSGYGSAPCHQQSVCNGDQSRPNKQAQEAKRDEAAEDPEHG